MMQVHEEDSRPLEGIQVLELGHYVAGPYCGRLLADYGASVLKIEPPDGDPLRRWPPFSRAGDQDGESLFFLYLNHGKETLTLDLKSTDGRERLLELAARADVVLENYRPGTLDRLGVGWEALHRANSKLILTSISSFGQTGPYREYQAWDIVESAMGGLAYIHGAPNREPLTHPNPQEQYRGGVAATTATVAALLNQLGDDDAGEHIDIAINECVTAALRDTIPQYTFMGAIRKRGARAGGAGAITATADGYVVPSGYGSADWSTFARFMNSPELDDERFQTGDGRQRYAAELRDILAHALQHWKAMEYFEGCQLWGMGAGIVLSPAQALECAQHLARGFFTDITTADGRSLPAPRGPFAL